MNKHLQSAPLNAPSKEFFSLILFLYRNTIFINDSLNIQNILYSDVSNDNVEGKWAYNRELATKLSISPNI